LPDIDFVDLDSLRAATLARQMDTAQPLLNLILAQLAAREPLFLVLSGEVMLLAQTNAVVDKR